MDPQGRRTEEPTGAGTYWWTGQSYQFVDGGTTDRRWLAPEQDLVAVIRCHGHTHPDDTAAALAALLPPHSGSSGRPVLVAACDHPPTGPLQVVALVDMSRTAAAWAAGVGGGMHFLRAGVRYRHGGLWAVVATAPERPALERLAVYSKLGGWPQ